MPNPNSVRQLCHRRLAVLRSHDNASPQFEIWVVNLVEENLASGRFQRFAAHRARQAPLRLAEYVDQVIFYATQEYARIRALEDSIPMEWNQLRDFLLHRAVSLVRRFQNETDGSAAALDFVQQTCAIIFEERYPCDVAFDAWATTILKNLIVAHYTRSRDLLNRSYVPESLDAPKFAAGENETPLGDLLAATDSLAPFEKIENQMVLLDAIEQLNSPAQQQLIRWSFLEELDDDQIARRLGKSQQAIYNLRQRALAQLKEILAEPPRKKSARKRIK